jgi:hypothetical protein
MQHRNATPQNISCAFFGGFLFFRACHALVGGFLRLCECHALIGGFVHLRERVHTVFAVHTGEV